MLLVADKKDYSIARTVGSDQRGKLEKLGWIRLIILPSLQVSYRSMKAVFFALSLGWAAGTISTTYPSPATTEITQYPTPMPGTSSGTCTSVSEVLSQSINFHLRQPSTTKLRLHCASRFCKQRLFLGMSNRRNVPRWPAHTAEHITP